MLDRWFKKEKPLQGLTGMGGGVVSRVLGGVAPFVATGGTKTGPTGGYFYHDYTTSGSGTPFQVTSGKTDIEVLLVGGGAGGGRGSGWGGGGGGGGAVGVYSVPIGSGTYDLTVGADVGGNTDGNYTRLGPSSSYIQAGGGNRGKRGEPPNPGAENGQGGSGGVNTQNNWSGYSLPGDYSGNNGQSRGGQDDGGHGGSVGGKPQSPTLWWRPYINPGSGGTEGGSNGSPDGGPGFIYGGGGKGTYSSGGSAGSGKQGRVVIRYPDAV